MLRPEYKKYEGEPINRFGKVRVILKIPMPKITHLKSVNIKGSNYRIIETELLKGPNQYESSY